MNRGMNMKTDRTISENADIVSGEEKPLSRREFLTSLGKWSKIVIGVAIGTGALLAAEQAVEARGAWANGGGGGGWANRGGGGGGGGAWANRGGGGGGAWANGGGGGGWVNRYGGGGAWANRGGVWANGGNVWVNGGGSWVNRY